MITTILYLTEFERDAVVGMVALGAVSVGDAVIHAKSSAELEQALEQARTHLALMRACEAGHLKLDDRLVARLRDERAELLEEVADERRRALAGQLWAEDLTPEQNAAKSRAQIDRILDEAGGLASILQRAGEPDQRMVA